jgi:hypothetical protein
MMYDGLLPKYVPRYQNATRLAQFVLDTALPLTEKLTKSTEVVAKRSFRVFVARATWQGQATLGRLEMVGVRVKEMYFIVRQGRLLSPFLPRLA